MGEKKVNLILVRKNIFVVFQVENLEVLIFFISFSLFIYYKIKIKSKTNSFKKIYNFSTPVIF